MQVLVASPITLLRVSSGLFCKEVGWPTLRMPARTVVAPVNVLPEPGARGELAGARLVDFEIAGDLGRRVDGIAIEGGGNAGAAEGEVCGVVDG